MNRASACRVLTDSCGLSDEFRLPGVRHFTRETYLARRTTAGDTRAEPLPEAAHSQDLESVQFTLSCQWKMHLRLAVTLIPHCCTQSMRKSWRSKEILLLLRPSAQSQNSEIQTPQNLKVPKAPKVLLSRPERALYLVRSRCVLFSISHLA